jgi:hypothetical protein
VPKHAASSGLPQQGSSSCHGCGALAMQSLLSSDPSKWNLSPGLEHKWEDVTAPCADHSARMHHVECVVVRHGSHLPAGQLHAEGQRAHARPPRRVHLPQTPALRQRQCASSFLTPCCLDSAPPAQCTHPMPYAPQAAICHILAWARGPLKVNDPAHCDGDQEKHSQRRQFQCRSVFCVPTRTALLSSCGSNHVYHRRI